MMEKPIVMKLSMLGRFHRITMSTVLGQKLRLTALTLYPETSLLEMRNGGQEKAADHYGGGFLKLHLMDKSKPWATGVRSPCGLGMIDGELFYDDNQGDWIGSGGIWHAKKGAFMGHPAGLKWASTLPNSPIKLTQEQVYATVDPRKTRDKDGNAIKPENVQNEKFLTLADMKKRFPETQLPAVWLPHGILGISNAEIVPDQTGESLALLVVSFLWVTKARVK